MYRISVDRKEFAESSQKTDELQSLGKMACAVVHEESAHT